MSTAPTVQRLTEPPPDFDALLAEIGDGLGELYGPTAHREYILSAPAHFQAALAHPDVFAYGVFHNGALTGLAVMVIRGGVARLILGHIRPPWAGLGYERALIETALAALRPLGADHVLAEFVPFTPFDDKIFRDLGFRHAERAIMLADAAAVAAHAPAPDRTAPYGPEDIPEMAAVLAAAYEGHPGRWLHPEAANPGAARDFIETAAAGAYGETPPGVIRLARSNGHIVGICVGAKAAAGVGFVLHAAVAPDARNQGIGAALVAAVAAAFDRAGYGRIGLGVTDGNPAERLYNRLGFARVRTIAAHAAWAEPDGTWSPSPRVVP